MIGSTGEVEDILALYNIDQVKCDLMAYLFSIDLVIDTLVRTEFWIKLEGISGSIFTNNLLGIFCSCEIYRSISFTQQQEKQDEEKVKIEKERLPQAVRNAFLKDDKIGKARIKEVWRMTGEDGKIYHAVKFDHEVKK